MSDRGRRGAGAPFYAPPRRKTSAEIISEARAAVYGESGGTASGAGGVLRPLRTRRPYTPREPQRTLCGERSKRREARPPSAFDLKHLTLSESAEYADVAGAPAAATDNAHYVATSSGDGKKQAPSPKKTNPSQKLGINERTGDGWSAFPKLPHLSGRSKPLHRRNTLGNSLSEEIKDEHNLTQSISVIKPLKGGEKSTINAQSPGTSSKARQYVKSVSCDGAVGDVAVKHLAVTLPHASLSDYNNLSFIEIAESLSQKHRNIDRSLLLIDSLQKLLAVNVPSQNIQELLLRALYSHFDVEDEQLMAAIARAMFMMRVTKQHLAAACKLIFKLARNDKNDHFFKNSDLLELLIEGCGRADPLTEGECCVYGVGALRFLALDPTLCEMAMEAGALHLAALHMKILNNAKAENPRSVSDQSTHAMYQLTGALRNLAGAGAGAGSAGGAGQGGHAAAFINSGALAELLNALAVHTDRDVLTNVARCLSVVSTWAAARAALAARAGSARALLRCLAACAARAPLAVRLAFVLGNLCAHRAAVDQILNEEGGVDVLLTILESYTKRNENGFRDNDDDPDLELVGTDLGGSDGSNEDVLIKTVRVVANLCLSSSAGVALATAHAPRALRALRGCLATAAGERDSGHAPRTGRGAGGAGGAGLAARRAELAAAALAAINNITFYRDAQADAHDDTVEQMCQECVWWVSRGARGEGALAASSPDSDSAAGAGAGAGADSDASPGADAAAEALRALGNLSRSPAAAQAIVLHGVLDHLDPFFQHEDRAVRCSAAGLLVNICGSGAAGGHAASRALSAAARAQDAAAAALLARALWNAHSHDALEEADRRVAVEALDCFLDDDSVFAACEAVRSDRRASDPEISSSHVHSNQPANPTQRSQFSKAYSVDQELHLQTDADGNGTTSGEDLGFEDGDEDCGCRTCVRLAEWEELVSVAIPLLEKLKPPKSDASVGTDEVFKSVKN